jgi:hypothetical protein
VGQLQRLLLNRDYLGFLEFFFGKCFNEPHATKQTPPRGLRPRDHAGRPDSHDGWLTATQRPFIYFPLARHFEQNLHVDHRLKRHGAGRKMDYRDSPPDAIAEEIDHPVDYLPVATDGAARAAGLIAGLI